MIRLWRLFFLIVFMVCLGGRAFAQDESQPVWTLEHDDLERTYHLTLPSTYDDSKQYPLLIALHPAVSSGNAMRAMTGLDSAAQEHDFIVVYPNSSGFLWGDGRDQYSAILQSTADDVGYIQALIATLEESYSIDPEKIYLTGQSSGGLMAYRLACEAPDLFAGVVIVSTLMWNYHQELCAQAEGEEAPAPVNMLIIQGNKDFIYPLAGREVESSTEYAFRTLSLQQTFAFWIDRNQCDRDGATAINNAAVIYDDCAGSVTVGVYIVKDGGHNWFRKGEDYVLNQFGIDATAMMFDYFAGNQDWAVEPRMLVMSDDIELMGYPRTYRYYVPTTYDPSVPTPLVVALHGRPDNGIGIAFITDMNPVAEKEGFIAVYPDGLSESWNYFYGLPVSTEYPNVVDDVLFLKTLIHDLSIDLNIDPARVYATGFSNGGFMTQLLACRATDTFAAFAVVGATLFPGLPGQCRDVDPVPMVFIHGSDDVSVPWNGIPIPGTDNYNAYPIANTLGFWADHNGCALQADYEAIPMKGDSPGTEVFYNVFPDCKAGTELFFYAVMGGGHNWPGVPNRITERIAGKVNIDINASEVIWTFFEQYTLQPQSR